MTSPQKENGYTPIANEIIDAMAAYRLPGEQMQCLLFVLRKTYGFNKKTDEISITQFEQATGMARKSVTRAIAGLCDKNIIRVKKDEKGRGKKAPMGTTKYTLNKHYWTWKHRGKKATNRGNIVPRVGAKKRKTKDNYTKDNIIPQSVAKKTQPHLSGEEQSKFYLTKKKLKLTGKRLESFERFWECFGYKKDKANAADAWLEIPQLTNSLVETICKAAEKEAADRPGKIAKGQTPIYAQGWISARRWEDEYQPPVNNKSITRKTPEQIQAELKEHLS
jgi:phage replication O-like protein O